MPDEMVNIHLLQKFSSMLCLIFFYTFSFYFFILSFSFFFFFFFFGGGYFFIWFKCDFHVDADRMIVNLRECKEISASVV